MRSPTIRRPTVYIGTGNGSPWSHQARSDGKGDNLFLSSIVALKPDTANTCGTTRPRPATAGLHGRAADHDADLTINGEKRHVVMQAPKNGFLCA